MNCHKCGKIIDDESKFCKYCGTPVDERLSADEDRTENEAESILSTPVNGIISDNKVASENSADDNAVEVK